MCNSVVKQLEIVAGLLFWCGSRSHAILFLSRNKPEAEAAQADVLKSDQTLEV